jgi:hypothetical protein
MGINRTRAEVAQQASDLTAASHSMRDRIIQQANTELAQPGITEQIKNELASYIVSANSTSDTIAVSITESVRLAYEFAII